MDLKLKGKVLLLSAASEGLGYGIAEEALREGAEVYIGSRNPDKVEAAVAALRKFGAARGSVLDMSSAASIREWTREGIKAYGRVDGLLVNAGGPPPGFFADFSDDDWQAAFELTLLSAVRLIREVLPDMKKNKGGAIAAITSITVKEPWPRLLLSGVMRSGVVSLVKCLSEELAPFNIRVNTIAPGRISTARLQKLNAVEAKKSGLSLEEQQLQSAKDISLGRAGEVGEFAKAGVFLLSDAASYITGQTLLVDGGLSKALF
jgi:3-oxoacyl-[acyl-carrier protein] reductase